jgi:nitrate reductase beta subunit
VLAAASTENDQSLYEAQRDVFLDPSDPEVIRQGERAGIARDWIDAAQRSPIYALINTYKVALPLHPEYRTMPMVWYIPPLSPVVDVVRDTGEDAEDKRNLFAAIDALRIPVEYLAELFTAGDVAPVDAVLKKLAAMRSYMRDINMGRDPDGSIPGARRRCMTCTACWRSRSTTSATLFRPPTPSRRTHSRSLPPNARSTTRADRAWADRVRSARDQALRHLWLWRTSRCCRTARPRTPWPAPRARTPA